MYSSASLTDSSRTCFYSLLNLPVIILKNRSNNRNKEEMIVRLLSSLDTLCENYKTIYNSFK